MELQADKGISERTLEVGDWVYLKLQPYKQVSLAIRSSLKLSSKYYGPYQVLERIGEVAYKLLLPPGSSLHPVLHVSQLKKKIGKGIVAQLDPPITGQEGQALAEPLVVLGKRLVKRRNQAVTQILVQWTNLPIEEATWEDYYHIRSQFPAFDPWGQGSLGGEGDVMTCEDSFSNGGNSNKKNDPSKENDPRKRMKQKRNTKMYE